MVNVLCLVLATTGGLLNVLARLALAYPDHQTKYCGKTYSQCYMRLALLLNLVLQLLTAAANVAAGFLGPVSIVLPTITSSQLVFNMLLFGGLRLEVFEKTKRVGTLVVMFATICLQVVGPKEQEDQDILGLLEEWYAIAWSVVLGILMVGSLVLVIWYTRNKQDETKKNDDIKDEEELQDAKLVSDDNHINKTEKDETELPPTNNATLFAILIVVQATSTIISTSAAKTWNMVSGGALMAAVAIWFVAGATLLYAVVVQSTEVNQSQFVPLSVTVNILVNALTGIIIWEDWRVVTSWVGYICVFFQLALGSYLLTELDLLHVYQERKGQALIPTGREATPLVASVRSSTTVQNLQLQLQDLEHQLSVRASKQVSSADKEDASSETVGDVEQSA